MFLAAGDALFFSQIFLISLAIGKHFLLFLTSSHLLIFLVYNLLQESKYVELRVANPNTEMNALHSHADISQLLEMDPECVLSVFVAICMEWYVCARFFEFVLCVFNYHIAMATYVSYSHSKYSEALNGGTGFRVCGFLNIYFILIYLYLIYFTIYFRSPRHIVFVGPLENLNSTIQAFLALFEVAELEWPFILVPV